MMIVGVVLLPVGVCFSVISILYLIKGIDFTLRIRRRTALVLAHMAMPKHFADLRHFYRWIGNPAYNGEKKIIVVDDKISVMELNRIYPFEMQGVLGNLNEFVDYGDFIFVL